MLTNSFHTTDSGDDDRGNRHSRHLEEDGDLGLAVPPDERPRPEDADLGLGLLLDDRLLLEVVGDLRLAVHGHSVGEGDRLATVEGDLVTVDVQGRPQVSLELTVDPMGDRHTVAAEGLHQHMTDVPRLILQHGRILPPGHRVTGARRHDARSRSESQQKAEPTRGCGHVSVHGGWQ